MFGWVARYRWIRIAVLLGNPDAEDREKNAKKAEPASVLTYPIPSQERMLRRCSKMSTAIL